jgi:hypothetical protein
LFNEKLRITSNNNNFNYFSDGFDLQIGEFVNARYSCGIALEDMNSFIVTGGMLNGIK